MIDLEQQNTHTHTHTHNTWKGVLLIRKGNDLLNNAKKQFFTYKIFYTFVNSPLFRRMFTLSSQIWICIMTSGGGGGRGGGTLIFSYIRRFGPFLGVRNFEFQFLGG